MNTRSESSILQSAVQTFTQLISALPGRPSTPTEQSRQGGIIRFSSLLITYYVLWALEHHPELYPDLRDQAPALREHQDRADHWSEMETFGLGLARYARQNYLREQSTALALAHDVLQRVRLTAQAPDLLPGVDLDQRQFKLFPAIAALLRQRAREVLARRKNAAGKSARPAADRQAHARAQVKADDNTALLRTFHEALSDREARSAAVIDRIPR